MQAYDFWCDIRCKWCGSAIPDTQEGNVCSEWCFEDSFRNWGQPEYRFCLDQEEIKRRREGLTHSRK